LRSAASVAGSLRTRLAVSKPARAEPSEVPALAARCSAAER
jgi:hypothetical protein